MPDARRTENDPHDPLTALTVPMLRALREQLGGSEVKAMIFLDDTEAGRGGLVLDGYDSDADAMVNLIMHLKAIFEANGKTLVIAPLRQG